MACRCHPGLRRVPPYPFQPVVIPPQEAPRATVVCLACSPPAGAGCQGGSARPPARHLLRILNNTFTGTMSLSPHNTGFTLLVLKDDLREFRGVTQNHLCEW